MSICTFLSLLSQMQNRRNPAQIVKRLLHRFVSIYRDSWFPLSLHISDELAHAFASNKANTRVNFHPTLSPCNNHIAKAARNGARVHHFVHNGENASTRVTSHYGRFGRRLTRCLTAVFAASFQGLAGSWREGVVVANFCILAAMHLRGSSNVLVDSCRFHCNSVKAGGNV